MKMVSGSVAALLMLAHAAAAQAPDPLSRVLASVSFDLNGDGWMDRAILIENSDGDADLLIFTGAQGKDGMEFRRALHKKALAFNGNIHGQMASLSVNRAGSLVVTSQNESIGRNRWNRTVTIAYRNNQFVVAGFTHNEHDTLAPNTGGACEVNYLSGRMTRNGKPFQGQVNAISLAAFDPDKLPAACKFGD